MEKLNLNTTITSSTPKENVSAETFQTAGEIFTYLNFCPPKGLSDFLSNLIKSESPKNIALAMMSLMQTTQNAAKKSSIRIFTKTMETFQLREGLIRKKSVKRHGHDVTSHYQQSRVIQHTGDI